MATHTNHNQGFAPSTSGTTTTPSKFQTVLLIGATGSIGSYILRALLSEPSLTVTILTRASSKSIPSLPPNITTTNQVRTITIDDTYPTDALLAAFRGQDAIISCLTTLSVADQFRMIDAAIAAGVKRYVPSEYGLNNMRADAQGLNSVFRNKGAVQQYLRDRVDQIEWMSVSCGMWIKWSVRNDFLGLRVRERKVELWDDGEGRFSVMTEENTALAVVRGLVAFPAETRNRNVLVEEFVTTQRELVGEIERQMGWRFDVARVDSRARIAELQAAVEKGDATATYGLIEAGFVTGRYGGDLSKEGEIMTEKLGLKRHSLQEVVADALASLQ
ncbi:NAD(P)-binding protein [Parathielavia appendiculata]|uniref:NAD(P)-binding protein n=1 Tax=Parathielavia appendiculata TaxID=2587402 RepID=A0AAN6TSH7_9PEZI|nr:NAD(P)-binding protein [Parathielavia appendiculata]